MHDPTAAGRKVDESPIDRDQGPQRRQATGELRLLFGCQGWPSGVLEIASWAKREGLAEPGIVSLRPDSLASQVAVTLLGREFVERLLQLKPHLVGFRLEGGGLEEVKAYVRAVRGILDATIVLGGPTATSHPREVLEDCGADYVFAGEAEEPFNQFLPGIFICFFRILPGIIPGQEKTGFEIKQLGSHNQKFGSDFHIQRFHPVNRFNELLSNPGTRYIVNINFFLLYKLQQKI